MHLKALQCDKLKKPAHEMTNVLIIPATVPGFSFVTHAF